MRAGRTGRLAWILAVALGTSGQPAGAQVQPQGGDWRDQIIYFLMIDRFDNGDPRNDDQRAGEFDPADGARYSGGDLAGVRRRLDYIQGLGATAVWITPPVAHQWWNPRANYGGYHGYWADDFTRIDPHFGSREDYRALAKSLHARGMRLVQDVVVNHVADYFHYDAPTADPSRGRTEVRDARGRSAPTQPPFDLNDARRARDRAAGIYHWTPDIRDYADPVQEQNWQLAGLDDLNTENPEVRRALRKAYGGWIRDVGVDAFRVDTAFYVPPAFFEDFLHADDAAAPGVLRVARGAGKPGFHVFGEGFALDRPFEDAQARRIESYVRGSDGTPRLPGMINFPLYGTALDVFARGRPTSELADRIERMMRVHSAPHLMPTFVDNHDVDRFLAAGDVPALKQALLMLMTLPGIPVIYYGTEQGFTGQRAAMFAGGFASAGRDHFDTGSEGYRYLQRVSALRRAHRLWSRGVPTPVDSNAAGAGALAYRVAHEGRSMLVAFNTAKHPVLVESLGGHGSGRLEPVFAIEGEAPAAAIGRPLVLPPRSGYVWAVGVDTARREADDGVLRIDPLPPPGATTQAVRGRAAPGAGVQLVLDGDLSRAVAVRADARGRWSADIDTGDLVDPEVVHRLVAFDRASGVASPALSLRARREWHVADDVEDPARDDAGRTGRYTYPDDALWRATRPGDLRRLRVACSGGALRLDIGLAALMRSWNPANGFDHVAVTVHVELPGTSGGLRVMPLQQAELPGDMRWHRRLRVGGWTNALFAAEGAGAEREGTPVTPGARLSVDPATDSLRLVFPASSLGRPGTLRGTRVHVSTWDYDGGYRGLSPTGGPHGFGGGAPTDAKILDEATLRVDDARCR